MTTKLLSKKVFNVIQRYAQRRGISDHDLGEYLHPGIEPECYGLANSNKAKARLSKAMAEQERVVIFGDYDADGITSTAILLRFFRECTTLRPQWKLPDRRTDQYGLDLSMAQKLMAEFQPTLLICLDNGTNSAEAVSWLRGQGVDTIVIDHHPATAPATDAVALINPKAHPHHACGDWDGLCAAGLALFFCNYLAVEWGCEPQWDHATAVMLAGLGTLADAVRLSGTNRALAKNAINLINSPRHLERCIGLRAVVSNDGQRMSQHRIEFEIVPQLNALGRLESAEPGVTLLTTVDEAEARRIAQHCFTLNERRKTLQKVVVEQATDQAHKLLKHHASPEVLVLADPDWLPGIVGPAASRIAEKFGRSAILLGMDGSTELWRGSGRAINSNHLGEWIEAAKGYGFVERGGGHAAAVGVVLRSEQILKLRVFADYYAIPEIEKAEPNHEVIGEVAELSSDEWYQVIELLEPFGPGNPLPRLSFRNAKLVGDPQELVRKETGEVWAIKGDFINGVQKLSAVWTDVEQAEVLWQPGVNYDLELELTARFFKAKRYFNWSVAACSESE